MTQEEFKKGLTYAKKTLEDISGIEFVVLGLLTFQLRSQAYGRWIFYKRPVFSTIRVYIQ